MQLETPKSMSEYLGKQSTVTSQGSSSEASPARVIGSPMGFKSTRLALQIRSILTLPGPYLAVLKKPPAYGDDPAEASSTRALIHHCAGPHINVVSWPMSDLLR